MTVEVTSSSPYEKPVPIGWSMYSMLANWLKELGFRDGVEAELTKWQGPFSWKRPIMLEQPGPPLNHVASGAVVGLLRDSKNQNHLPRRQLESSSGQTAQRLTYSCWYQQTDIQSIG